jgi:hypothetical protein
MLNRILEYFGFRLCKDVWTENELLRKELAAAEVNLALRDEDREQLEALIVTERKKKRLACLRIIELEGEVNEWAVGNPACTELPYPRKEG